MVQNLDLEIGPHSNPYQVCGLHKGAIEVSKCCLVYFSIGKNYKDEVWCNVFLMKENIYYLGDCGLMKDNIFMIVSSILILLR